MVVKCPVQNVFYIENFCITKTPKKRGFTKKTTVGVLKEVVTNPFQKICNVILFYSHTVIRRLVVFIGATVELLAFFMDTIAETATGFCPVGALQTERYNLSTIVA